MQFFADSCVEGREKHSWKWQSERPTFVAINIVGRYIGITKPCCRHERRVSPCWGKCDSRRTSQFRLSAQWAGWVWRLFMNNMTRTIYSKPKWIKKLIVSTSIDILLETPVTSSIHPPRHPAHSTLCHHSRSCKSTGCKPFKAFQAPAYSF